MNDRIAMCEHAGALEELLGYMINRTLKSGSMKKSDIVIMLEDMIQQVERGSLETILEYT